MKIEIPENPNWANNKQLKALNEKLDDVVQRLSKIEEHLFQIARNTRPEPLVPGSSYKRP